MSHERTCAHAAFEGAIEHAGEHGIVGWAVDCLYPERPVTLNIFLYSLWIGSVRTLQARPDIASRFGAQPRCGFHYRLPAYLRAPGTRSICLFIANTDIEVTGSPVMLGHSAEIVRLGELPRLEGSG